MAQDQHPLTNPSPKQVQQQESQEQQETLSVKRSSDQIKFKIKRKNNGLDSWIEQIKVSLKRRSEVLELSPFWKGIEIPAVITTSSFVIVILLVGLVFEYKDLPPKIPFFYNSSENHWEQINKSSIIFFPIVLMVFYLIQIKLVSKIFKKDRRLAKTTSWVISFINVLLLISISQIYSLVS